VLRQMLDHESNTAVRTRTECESCGKSLERSTFEVRTANASRLRCLRCALTFGPLVRRSAIVALIVGTILTAINQGNVILGGDFPTSLYWKIPLTYAVPYCVATTGALLNGRRHLQFGEDNG